MNNYNNFTATGFIGKDAEVKNIGKAQIARTSINIGTKDRNGNKVSAFMNIEALRVTNTADFELLKKGKHVKVLGYFLPEEWEKDGQKFNRVILRVTKVEELTKEAEKEAAEADDNTEAAK